MLIHSVPKCLISNILLPRVDMWTYPFSFVSRGFVGVSVALRCPYASLYGPEVIHRSFKGSIWLQRVFGRMFWLLMTARRAQPMSSELQEADLLRKSYCNAYLLGIRPIGCPVVDERCPPKSQIPVAKRLEKSSPNCWFWGKVKNLKIQF